MNRRYLLLVVTAALAAVTTLGCSARASQPDAEDPDRWSYVISYAMEYAERLDAAPEQIAILEKAEQAGELPFELYSEAVDNALRCLRETGVEPYDGGVRDERGFPERFYSIPAEAEAADPVEFAPDATVHRCIAEHSLAVEGLYQNQPSSVEAEEAHRRATFEPHRAAIVGCAVREGIEVDPEGDILEIVNAVWAAFHGMETEVDCTEDISW